MILPTLAAHRVSIFKKDLHVLGPEGTGYTVCVQLFECYELLEAFSKLVSRTTLLSGTQERHGAVRTLPMDT